MRLLGIFGVIKGAVNITGTIVKAGKEKAAFRHFHHPVPYPVMEFISGCIIGKPGFGKIDRANAA